MSNHPTPEPARADPVAGELVTVNYGDPFWQAEFPLTVAWAFQR